MDDQLVRNRLISILVLALGSILVWLPTSLTATTQNELRVHFLDVGQGDAILIQTPDGFDALIDGGPDNGVLSELNAHLSFFDRELNLVVATHEDNDHIGGLIGVLERFTVDAVLYTENQGGSNAARTYDELVAAEGATLHAARRGQRYQLGASTTLEVLWPETETRDLESNASSIVLMLHYGNTRFLLTGDAPKRIEEYLVLTHGEALQADVLKVGHHGSRTSTSEVFLAEVEPQYAVISTEKDSRYGHPHVEVTDALFNARIETFSTAEAGTVTFLSDGNLVWRE